MYSAALKKLGAELGLSTGGGLVYGALDGMGAVMFDGMGTKTLVLYLGEHDGEWPDLQGWLDQPAPKYRILSYTLTPHLSTLTIVFHDTIGTIKHIRNYINRELPKFSQAGFAGVSHCAHCHKSLSPDAIKWLVLKPTMSPQPMHEDCAGIAEQEIADHALTASTEVNEEKRGHPILGIIGALLGGIVGAIPWVLAYALGYFVSLLGVLIGVGADFGHKLFGGRPGKGRLVVVILTTLVMVLVAQLAGEVFSLALTIQDGSLAESWGLMPGDLTMKDLYPIIDFIASDPQATAEFMAAFVPNLLLGYLFAALGIFSLYFSRLRRENTSGKVKAIRLN